VNSLEMEPAPARDRKAGNVLWEVLAIGAAGIILGLVGNSVSPRGLVLTRDYFFLAQPAATNTTTNALAGGTTNGASAAQILEALLRSEGLRLADSNLVAQLYADPRRAQDLVVFIDAREDKFYKEGHIPGAYELDYYHPEPYFPTVMPVCAIAEQVVVYCNGGDCEDSRHAAQMLGSMGIAKDKLLVYAGGIREWERNRLPVEVGERKSGQMRAEAK